MKIASLNYKFIFLITGIFFVGFLLRAQETISYNFLFLIDQGRDMLAVKEIVFHHNLTFIGPYTSLGGVFQGPGWYYLLSIPTFLFDGNPWSGVFLMLILSMGLLFATFFIINRLFGLPSAIVTTLLLAFAPEAIAAATFAWNPHPMWLIIFGYIVSLYYAIYKDRRYYLLVWPLLFLMFHFEMALGVFLVVATCIYLLLAHRKQCNEKYLSIGFILGLTLLIPQILFELKNNFLMTRSIVKLFRGSDQGLFVTNENMGLLSLFSSHLHTFIVNFQSAFPHEGLFVVVPFIAFVLLIGSLMYGKQNLGDWQWRFVKTVLSIVGIVLALSFFYPFPMRYWFLTGFALFYVLAIGVIWGSCLKKTWGKVFIGIFVFCLFFWTIGRIDVLYLHPPDNGGVAKVKGKLASIDWIYNDAGEEPFGLLVFTPPVNTDAYDYLIWWRAHIQHKDIPHKEKRGLVYLLMEPDPEKPWSYKGWLETVIVSGEVIETQTLPSGHVIQKRLFK